VTTAAAAATVTLTPTERLAALTLHRTSPPLGVRWPVGQTFGDDAPKFSFEILIILTQISRKF